MSQDSKVLCLSSGSEADDIVRNEFTIGKKRNFHCTACGTEMFAISEIYGHPWLHGVGICCDCFDFLLTGLFTKDPVDCTDEQCRWCGQGGTIIMCDNCENAFCENCIVRNYGRKRGLAPILSNVNWKCFCCNPKPLWVHVNRLKEFRNSLSSEINFSPRPKDARTSKTRHASQNISDVNLRNQCQTTPELLAQNKEEQQNQGNGIQTISRNMKSRVTPSTQKRVATCCTEERHPPQAKQNKGIERPQQAPAVPSARTFIRPHQATKRRKRMAAETLKSGVTNVKENDTQQHDSNLQAKPEMQDGLGQLSRHKREVDHEIKVKKQYCIVM